MTLTNPNISKLRWEKKKRTCKIKAHGLTKAQIGNLFCHRLGLIVHDGLMMQCFHNDSGTSVSCFLNGGVLTSAQELSKFQVIKENRSLCSQHLGNTFHRQGFFEVTYWQSRIRILPGWIITGWHCSRCRAHKFRQGRRVAGVAGFHEGTVT